MDFRNGAKQDVEYFYDENGNLIKDLNKGIADIQYNLLNLPRRITFNDTNKSTHEYVYSADGKKLSVIHKSSAENRTDYIGNMIYENGSLKRILVDGGYIENGIYYFYLQDHLGNNRVVAKSDGTVTQTNHYYPFGNLFTGEFAYKSFTGTVQFGQTYAFTARPSAMKVKYHAHVGTVDKVRTSGDICPYIKKGDPDMARIFVAIVDWNAPHEVVSGMTTTKGAWDPEKGIDNVSEGKILGYGSLWITQSTDGEDMQDAELDIVWYDHETRPAEGKYSLVISCACNAYGDYFTGCSKNVMYVDDFEWVY